MSRAILIVALALGCFGLVALAQPAGQPDKKTDPPNGKDDPGKLKGKVPEKAKPPEKTIDPVKETPKPKVPLDKMKLPKDAIIVVVDDLLNATGLFPKITTVNLEEYLAQLERLKVLEGQLKAEKKAPSWCKLRGKLDGDFIVFSAEYSFSTEQPRTAVVLGLQGGHLTEEGDLDRQIPFLDYDKDDGFFVRVEKEGSHQLTLHFRVPVQTKKSSAGTMEREIDLGLPGAAGTILNLELSTAVKELRWNKTLEKTKTPGRWQIGVGMGKALNLAWKEPLALAGNTPLAKAESLVKVDVDATHVNISADLFLEDSRLQTTQWHLFVPPQAKIEEVKAPVGLPFELILPDKGKLHYTLDTFSATAERWQVKVSLRVPRPNQGTRVAIGPFHVLGMFQQTGTITVNSPAEFSFGQRLVPTRNGEVYQQTNTETEAVFKYVALPISDKNLKALQALKAPLELEWRAEKSQIETKTVHKLEMQVGQQGWDVEATTQLHAQALFATVQAIDLALPVPQPRDLWMIGTAGPSLEFPGALPWAGIWKARGAPWTYASPEGFAVFDAQGVPLKLVAQDAAGKVRVLLRSPAKEAKLVVKTTYRIPLQNQRIRLELPRPLNTQDRGAKLTIKTDKQIELMYGPAGAEEPVPDRDRFDLSWDQAPGFVDLAWRPYHRELTAYSTLDLLIHEHTAQVTQTLRLPRDAGPGPVGKSSQIALRVAPGIERVSVVTKGEATLRDVVGQTLWVDGDQPELRLEYDVAIGAGQLEVTPLGPVMASQQDVKVRVWCRSGIKASLAPGLADRGAWKDRSIEAVAGKAQFPSLVLQGFGPLLPLTLKIEESPAPPSAAFIADRALIQVRMLDDGGSQQCRAIYLIQELHATYLDIELPVPAPFLKDGPTFTLGGKKLEAAEKIDATGKVVRVQLHPELVTLPTVLEIAYTIPADAMEVNAFWRTTLHAPMFRSPVVIGHMRWQLLMSGPVLAASLGRHAQPDLQWGLQSWLLTPEPSGTSAELEAWAPANQAFTFTYSFAQVSAQPETVYHLPRTWWLLGCSGLFLVATLGGFLSPLPRWVFWLLVAALAAGMLALGVLCPAVVPPLLFGLQPGVILFLVFALGHWLVQERQRRQLVLLTGFSRTKPGSTMVRTAEAKRPREQSTVDEPEPPEAPADQPTSSQAGS
ncbi:MAG: hypothetical protein EXR98_08700 [Gemmataceae bacterium]|nr:hypothetical protein [Gemmataceae bacterium]